MIDKSWIGDEFNFKLRKNSVCSQMIAVFLIWVTYIHWYDILNLKMLIYHGKSVCYDIKARKRYEIRQLNTDFVPTEIFVVPKFPKFHLISRASIKRAHLKWPDFGYLETKFQIKKYRMMITWQSISWICSNGISNENDSLKYGLRVFFLTVVFFFFNRFLSNITVILTYGSDRPPTSIFLRFLTLGFHPIFSEDYS